MLHFSASSVQSYFNQTPIFEDTQVRDCKYKESGTYVNPNTANVYVGNEGSNTVSVIGTTTPQQAVPKHINTIDSMHLSRSIMQECQAAGGSSGISGSCTSSSVSSSISGSGLSLMP
jgi:YVTN family beta-propeller protein